MADFFTGKESESFASPSGGIVKDLAKAKDRHMADANGAIMPTTMPVAQQSNRPVNSGYKLVVESSGMPQPATPSQPSTPTTPETPTTPTSPGTGTGNGEPTTPTTPTNPTTPSEPSTPTIPTTPSFPLTLSKPVFTKPAANATGLSIGTSLRLEITPNTGTAEHVSTDWECRKSFLGLLSTSWQSYQDAVNKLAINVPGLTLSLGTTYYLRARYRGPNGMIGEWSDETKITMALL